ncbi:MAG TPA: penicillin-binding protein activator [Rhizomicrobium sp.]|jgi:ABC-type branched-subunit amino acid transport system substrate-binding protein|nr:penicillin-binding protein activator [Rhizomicrobium sp.]
MTSERRAALRLCAIVAAISIGALAACQAPAPLKPPPPPPPPPEPAAPHQLSADQPDFLRLPNLESGKTPLRVGIILPFTNAPAGTRALAGAMLKAAELALYDSGDRDMVLMTADDSAKPEDAAAAADKLLAQGAEVIVGPLFAGSVSAVAPVARDRGVPVIAFSTDRSVAGHGVYLLSFQLQNEIQRVISYAAQQGHKTFAAMIPSTSYGQASEQAFREAVAQAGGAVGDVEHFSPGGSVMDQTTALAKTNPDAVFIAQGGAMLRSIAPTLAYNFADPAKVKLLGTGLWDDAAITREPSLTGGWFAAPAPDADRNFMEKYREAFGSQPPPLAALAYDAISLVALLGAGQPYHRFTEAALTDPNGFEGVDGIFRFKADGAIERGLAVLAVRAGGFDVVSPAPTTFETKGT